VSPPPTSSTPAPGAGEAQARWFAEQVHPHDLQLKAYLRGAFPSVRDVEDVVQESYLRVWRAKAVQEVRSVRAFLFTVARRLAIDLVRRERFSPIAAADEREIERVPVDAPDAAELAGTHEKVRLVAEALVSLPPRCREVVMLYKLQGLPRPEVARRLGLAEKTVDEHLARGVAKLERWLRRRGVDGHYGS
jgi:RNA polymerase sigma-70 factor (ECF subfamily)